VPQSTQPLVRGRAEEEIPLQLVGHPLDGVGHLDALRPDRAVRPDVDGVDRADGAAADVFVDEAGVVAGVALVAHLGHDVGLGGQPAQIAGLADRPGQRLLGVDVQPALHRVGGNLGVGVIGRPDDDPVNLVGHVVEHPPVVVVHGRVGVRLEGVRGVVVVGVGEGDDVFRPALSVGIGVCGHGQISEVAFSHAAHPDGGNVNRVAGGLVAGPAQHAPGHDQGSG